MQSAMQPRSPIIIIFIYALSVRVVWGLYQLSADSAFCGLCTDRRTTEILYQLFHRFCGKIRPQNLWKHPQNLQNIQKHAKTTEFYINYFSVHRKKSTDLWRFSTILSISISIVSVVCGKYTESIKKSTMLFSSAIFCEKSISQFKMTQFSQFKIITKN